MSRFAIRGVKLHVALRSQDPDGRWCQHGGSVLVASKPVQSDHSQSWKSRTKRGHRARATAAQSLLRRLSILLISSKPGGEHRVILAEKRTARAQETWPRSHGIKMFCITYLDACLEPLCPRIGSLQCIPVPVTFARVPSIGLGWPSRMRIIDGRTDVSM